MCHQLQPCMYRPACTGLTGRVGRGAAAEEQPRPSPQELHTLTLPQELASAAERLPLRCAAVLQPLCYRIQIAT